MINGRDNLFLKWFLKTPTNSIQKGQVKIPIKTRA
jgi:hypothetical protein